MTPDERAALRQKFQAASDGPWDLLDSRTEPWHFTAPNGTQAWPEGGMAFQFLGAAPSDLSSDYGPAIFSGIVPAGVIQPSREDLLLMASAGSDLPAVLDALDKDERRIAELEAELAKQKQSLESPFFQTWTCVFPGKIGIAWKRAWHGVGTREEAEAQAAKNCNVVAVPLPLWDKINEYQRRSTAAERELCERTGVRLDYHDGNVSFIETR